MNGEKGSGSVRHDKTGCASGKRILWTPGRGSPDSVTVSYFVGLKISRPFLSCHSEPEQVRSRKTPLPLMELRISDCCVNKAEMRLINDHDS
ncbi:hypothetical protein RRG08_025688 [Elysia crispata]|uniref:Uncharacterized protein n=1 Tax=Elysia crispata TaxID=231223 RepID=A0AAE1AXD9_9GAST|nr:hypothetical protein RRG08_025688 [Elysia crispata]